MTSEDGRKVEIIEEDEPSEVKTDKKTGKRIPKKNLLQMIWSIRP